MIVGFEDTAELDLRVVVSLSPAEIMALRAGLPISFALMAAHADGVRCVLVSQDVRGAAARAKMSYPEGRVLTVADEELERLHDGRGGLRIEPESVEHVPFKLALAKLRPAKPSRSMTPPTTQTRARSWRRGVRFAFAVSMAAVLLLAIGDVLAVSIGLGALVVGVLAWLAYDAWWRKPAPPQADAPAAAASGLEPQMPAELTRSLGPLAPPASPRASLIR